MFKQLSLLSMLLLSLCACSVVRKPVDAVRHPPPAPAIDAHPTAVAISHPTVATPQKPLVVEFYSTLCAICKQIQPAVNKIEDHYKGRIEFRAYDVAGIKDDVKRQFKFIGYPQIVIINTQGEIIFNRLGFQTYESLKADLDAVLKD